MKEQHRLRLAEMEADSQLGRLQLSEADRQKLQAAILLKDDRVALLEEETSQLQAERRRLKEDNTHRREPSLSSLKTYLSRNSPWWPWPPGCRWATLQMWLCRCCLTS